MVRDPRALDQNPVVIEPADVEAVLDDRPTKVSDPLKPPMEEIDADEEADDTPVADRAGQEPDLIDRIPGEPPLDMPEDEP